MMIWIAYFCAIFLGVEFIIRGDEKNSLFLASLGIIIFIGSITGMIVRLF